MTPTRNNGVISYCCVECTYFSVRYYWRGEELVFESVHSVRFKISEVDGNATTTFMIHRSKRMITKSNVNA